ncbi:MAG: hypothetical protein WCY93_08545 [Anaerolineaceae bacterium]
MTLPSFLEFITEAKVSRSNLDKVADIFKRIIERELQTRLYRFGGPRGYCEINKGEGILYFYDRTKAIRINYLQGGIKSLTLWNKFKLGTNGDFTVDLDGMGLLGAGKKLIDVIRRPAPAKIPAYAELTESADMLVEAKRISPDDFFELVQKNVPPSIQMNRVPWGVLSDIALSHDRQIPSIVRAKKVPGKGGFFDLTQITSDAGARDADKPARQTEPLYYIKVTAQDPNTKAFLSVKGDKKAEDMLKTISHAVNNPDVKQEVKNPESLFGILKSLVKLVSRGSRNSLVVIGGARTGKSHIVVETLKEEGLAKNRDWYIVKGKITTSALYQTLFLHRKGGILVFDDADSMWGDSEASNILKAALDSYDTRTISWISPRTINVSRMPDAEKEQLNDNIDDRLLTNTEDPKIRMPSEFNYEGRIIFISNLSIDKMDSAVLNRSAKIDMTLTDEQMFLRMRSILPHLGDRDVPLDVKEEILDYLRGQNIKGILKAPSMRTFVAAVDLYKSGLPEWKTLLDYV